MYHKSFSAPARAAVHYANELRERTGAALTVVHVITPIHYLETVDAAAIRHEARIAAVNTLDALKPAPTRTMVVDGIAHDAIVKTAHEIDADLIVVGTQGRSLLQRLLIGSVAENVVRHARCPVVTVPPRR